MKRFLAIMACACILAASLVGCSGKGAFVGDWQLSRMDNGVQVRETGDIDKLRESGLNVTLNLADDGTAKLNLFGSESTGSWEAESGTVGTIRLSDGEDIEMTLEGSKLTLKQDESTLEFTRYEAEPKSSGDAATGEGAEGEAVVTDPEKTRTPLEPGVDTEGEGVAISIGEKRNDANGNAGILPIIMNGREETIKVVGPQEPIKVGDKTALLQGELIVAPGEAVEGFFWFNQGELGTGNLDDIANVEGSFVVMNEDGSEVLATIPFSF